MTSQIVPTEAQEAKVLVAYLRTRGYKFWHTANETGAGKNARFMGIRNKQQGVSKGVPDYFIIVNNQLVAIELKRQKRSVTSPEQKQWIETLNNAGVKAFIAKGAIQAIDIIEQISNRN